MADKQKAMNHLKQNLSILHDDWLQLVQQEKMAQNPTFLKKMAGDIQKLDQEAKESAHIKGLKNAAQLVHFALSTPWGAPFIGESTLIEAANSYTEGNTSSSLEHLLSDFSLYCHDVEAPIFKVFDEIFDELKS